MINILWKKRELLLSLVKRDLKTRYKSSVLGFFWSVGRPLFLSLILIFVFGFILDFSGRFSDSVQGRVPVPFWLHILAGMLAWGYFANSVIDALGSILANLRLIAKIRLETAVIPAASIASNLIHFILALLVFLFIFRCAGHWPSWEILLLPLVLLIQTIFIAGLALLVSSLNVYYRDVGSIVEILTAAWFYLTPVLYPVYMAERKITGFLVHTCNFTDRWADVVFQLYYLNPMAAIVVAYRRLLLIPAYPGSSKEMPDAQLLYYLLFSLALSLAFYFIARRVFCKLSPYFADEL